VPSATAGRLNSEALVTASVMVVVVEVVVVMVLEVLVVGEEVVVVVVVEVVEVEVVVVEADAKAGASPHTLWGVTHPHTITVQIFYFCVHGVPLDLY